MLFYAPTLTLDDSHRKLTKQPKLESTFGAVLWWHILFFGCLQGKGWPGQRLYIFLYLTIVLATWNLYQHSLLSKKRYIKKKFGIISNLDLFKFCSKSGLTNILCVSISGWRTRWSACMDVGAYVINHQLDSFSLFIVYPSLNCKLTLAWADSTWTWIYVTSSCFWFVN